MRIAICPGAAAPTGPGPSPWPGCVLGYRLALLAVARGHEVHLFGPGGTSIPPGVRLHYIPGSYGMQSADCDAKACEWYPEVLAACEVVHDLSPSLILVESLFLDEHQARYLYTADPADLMRPRFGRRCATGPFHDGAGYDGPGWEALYRRVAARDFWSEVIALP